MSDYTKTVDFAAKDALASGNPAKSAKGTELNTELTNIQTAIATKHDDGDIIKAADGTAGACGVTFPSDLDTGLIRDGTNSLCLVAGGVNVMSVQPTVVFLNAGRFLIPDGAASAPNYSWFNDIDTGLYHDTANQIAIGLGGVTAGQIAQGIGVTFTMAGVSGSPTFTGNWQMFGKQVTIVATSAAANTASGAISFSGLPTVIRPSITVGCTQSKVTSNSNTVGGFATVNTSGTVAMFNSDGTAISSGACGVSVGSHFSYMLA